MNITNNNDDYCLKYCTNGMNTKLLKFYEENTGYLKLINVIGRTRNERIQHLLYFYNAYYLAIGLSLFNKTRKLDKQEFVRVIASDQFKVFGTELLNTIKNNQDYLTSKLNSKQLKKLNILIEF